MVYVFLEKHGLKRISQNSVQVVTTTRSNDLVVAPERNSSSSSSLVPTISRRPNYTTSQNVATTPNRITSQNRVSTQRQEYSSPTSSAATIDNQINLYVGCHVDIWKGTHEDKSGIVKELTRCTAKVSLDHPDTAGNDPVTVSQTSLRPKEQDMSTPPRSSSSINQRQRHDFQPSVVASESRVDRVMSSSDWNINQYGQHEDEITAEEGSFSSFEENYNDSFPSRWRSGSTAETASLSSLSFSTTPQSFNMMDNTESITVHAPGAKAAKGLTFAQHLFGKRLFSVNVQGCKVWPPDVCNKIEPRFSDGGCEYELLLSDIHNDNQGGGFFGRANYRMACVYVCVKGRGLPPLNLQEALNGVANFAALNPQKCAARLDLFDTPAIKSKLKGRDYLFFSDLTSEDFEEIPEFNHEGCGFIPRKYLEQFLGTLTVGRITNAIQVRIFAPELGIFKGVLMEKRGISKIQLPSSMKKVKPSLVPGDDWACLLIKQLFPSQPSRYVERVLNPHTMKPPPKSFQPKEITDMITRLWQQSWNVSDDLIRSYHKRFKKPVSNLGHAFVVGVSDCTGCLPEGHVFVPHLANNNDVIVSRCPCMEKSDILRLPLVREKPVGMKQSDWDFINHELSFGIIMFGNSRPGYMPLPCHVAKGDLDGDLYFVCWDESIVGALEHIPRLRLKRQETEKDTNAPPCHDWLKRTQQLSIDISRRVGVEMLVGRLYNESKKVADKSVDGTDDVDAIELGCAYEKALDLSKHGGKVPLKSHLWHHVPSNLQQFLDTK